MNASSSGIWDNPPPPGTEDDQAILGVAKVDSESPRAIDRIDPYVKNPQYLEYEKKSGRVKRSSRSKSYDRHEKRRRSRSRSKSRSKYRSRRSRSSSRSRSHRRRKYSRSRSRSLSKSRGKYSRREKEKRSRRYSRSRNSSRSRHPSRSKQSSRSRYSRSRSRSRSQSKSYKLHRSSRHRRNSKDHSDYEEKPVLDSSYESVDVKVEEEEESESIKDNAFKNDGSFLEMFKKMQEEKKAQEEAQKAECEKNMLLPTFGKRRGGRVLKTGMVQKSKPQDSEENVQDPWSVYMKEVKKYKEACCDDDSKSRLLVK